MTSSGSARLMPLRGPDHEAVLRRALEMRRAGNVPLIGDERWSDARWTTMLRSLDRRAIHPEAEWAVFTSGSTGHPRVILRTQRSWDVAYPGLNRIAGITNHDRMLIAAHPVSSMATFAASHSEHTGFDFTVPQRARVSAEDLRDVTVLHGTPWHVRDVLDLLDAGCSTPLRKALVGGDRVEPGLRRRAERHGITVHSYIGASELSLIAVDSGDGAEIFDGVEVDIRDSVLWVRTEQLALGCLGGSGSLRRDGEWASVGDRASLHHDRLTLHGRDDDAILTAGATVIPSDVESVLQTLPGVRASVVVGIPHARVGQIVAAAVESSLAEPNLREITARAYRELSVAERPRRWKMVKELPRTSVGKVRRITAEEFEALPEVRPMDGGSGSVEGGRT
ncbi:long-chain fatty acid--CoA ligase [Kocuria sp. HSID16901]|nr:long-chain fatty acid--CoA ligase [Kocuria sp. HSID16901]